MIEAVMFFKISAGYLLYMTSPPRSRHFTIHHRIHRHVDKDSKDDCKAAAEVRRFGGLVPVKKS